MVIVIVLLQMFPMSSLEVNAYSEDNYFDNQKSAIKFYNDYLDYLRLNAHSSHDFSSYYADGIAIEDYPEYYAGAYINKDGNLVMQIVEEYFYEDSKKKEWIHDLENFDSSKSVIILPAKRSYRELLVFLNYLSYEGGMEEYEKKGCI